MRRVVVLQNQFVVDLSDQFARLHTQFHLALQVFVLLLDEEALNKEKTGFHIGGYKKFRTKTIDRKDELFNKFAEAVK